MFKLKSSKTFSDCNLIFPLNNLFWRFDDDEVLTRVVIDMR